MRFSPGATLAATLLVALLSGCMTANEGGVLDRSAARESTAGLDDETRATPRTPRNHEVPAAMPIMMPPLFFSSPSTGLEDTSSGDGSLHGSSGHEYEGTEWDEEDAEYEEEISFEEWDCESPEEVAPVEGPSGYPDAYMVESYGVPSGFELLDGAIWDDTMACSMGMTSNPGYMDLGDVEDDGLPMPSAVYVAFYSTDDFSWADDSFETTEGPAMLIAMAALMDSAADAGALAADEDAGLCFDLEFDMGIAFHPFQDGRVLGIWMLMDMAGGDRGVAELEDAFQAMQASTGATDLCPEGASTGPAGPVGQAQDGYPADYSPEGYGYPGHYVLDHDPESLAGMEEYFGMTSNPGYMDVSAEDISEDPDFPDPEMVYATFLVHEDDEELGLDIAAFQFASDDDADLAAESSDKCEYLGPDDRVLRDDRVFVQITTWSDDPDEGEYAADLASRIMERTGATDEC